MKSQEKNEDNETEDAPGKDKDWRVFMFGEGGRESLGRGEDEGRKCFEERSRRQGWTWLEWIKTRPRYVP